MKVFIGCTKEALHIREKIEDMVANMGHEPILWNDPKEYDQKRDLMSSVMGYCRNADAGIFIATHDYSVKIGEEVRGITGENVWFEFGLMVGTKGLENTILCVTGEEVCKPSDYDGSIIVNISALVCGEDQLAIKRIYDELRIWLDGILIRKMIGIPNTYVASRKEIEESLDLVRDNFKKRFTRRIKKIRILGIALPAIFATDRADYSYKDKGFKRDKIFNYIKAAVKAGAELEVITNAPLPALIQDAKAKVPPTGRTVEERIASIYDVYFNIKTLKSSGSNSDPVFASASKDENGSRFIHKLTNIVLPYSLFQIIFEDSYKGNNHIKVDIYSPEVASNGKRISMVFFESTDNDNYKFFDENFTQISNNLCLSDKEIEESEERWQYEWDEIKKKEIKL